MSTTLETPFKREILGSEANVAVTGALQNNLTNLIDLALLMKQAHWNVIGQNFRSIHLQLDEIIADVRNASDEVAERMTTLGVEPDGRASTVAENSSLKAYPAEFVDVSRTITLVADALKTTITELRSAIEKLGELDPVSEDMCISISASLEKHLWMLQAQER